MQHKTEYSNTPRYEGQPRELTPEGKKFLGKAAAVLLALTVATGVGVSQKENIKKFFDNTFYSSVDKDIDGPAVEANGLGRPEVLTPPSFVEITEVTIPEDKNILLVENARLRTSPVFGDEEIGKTTLATLGEQVALTDIDNYTLCKYPNGDQFIGISSQEMQIVFENVKIEFDFEDKVWVNAGEVDIVDKVDNTEN